MISYPSRCQHIKVNGTQCGSPALRRNKLRFFHKRFHSERILINQARARRRAASFELPVLEDANSIQVSLMQVIRLLAMGHLDAKTAGLLLYALQIASANLRHTRFEPYLHSVVLDPRTVSETPLNGHIWEDSDFEDEEEEDEDVAAQEESNHKELAPGRDPVTGENPPWAQNLPPLNLKKRVSNHHIIYPQPSREDTEPRHVTDAMRQLSKLIGGPPPPPPDQRE